MEASISQWHRMERENDELKSVETTEAKCMWIIDAQKSNICSLQETCESLQHSKERADEIITTLQTAQDATESKLQDCVLWIKSTMSERDQAEEEKRRWIYATILATVIAIIACIKASSPETIPTDADSGFGTSTLKKSEE